MTGYYTHVQIPVKRETCNIKGMCGRFTLRTPGHIIARHFNLRAQTEWQLPLRYNIAPTQEILTIRDTDSGQREAETMRWGLVPSWSKDPKSGPPLINARSETVADKPSFRTALRRRRCLIPADGFYEWRKEGRAKQPFYIHRPDEQPFAFAGLWERWAGGPTIESCTIITTAANTMMRELHDRMPVIISSHDYGQWLDPTVDDPAALQYLLAPAPEDELVAEAVSTHVNKVANDDPECVRPL